MAGITLLYALWTHSDRVWSVRISNDIRACSTVLFVMGERATWVKKYRDAFELLVNAAMEKLQGSEAAKTAGMAELMTAQQLGVDVSGAAGIGLGGFGPGVAFGSTTTGTGPVNNPSAGASTSHTRNSGLDSGPGLSVPTMTPDYPAAATVAINPQTTGLQPDLNLNQPASLDAASQDHGVRMAMQLAPWIDLEEGHGPFWVPDFETLENLSGGFWPAPFEPL
jgi:hypothetical protein